MMIAHKKTLLILILSIVASWLSADGFPVPSLPESANGTPVNNRSTVQRWMNRFGGWVNDVNGWIRKIAGADILTIKSCHPGSQNGSFELKGTEVIARSALDGVLNRKFAVEFSGELGKNITVGSSVTLNMTLLGAKFVTKKIDLCELLDDVSGGMAKCPLSPGSIGYQYDFDLAGHPSKGIYAADIEITDQDGDSVLCVQAELNLAYCRYLKFLC